MFRFFVSHECDEVVVGQSITLSDKIRALLLISEEWRGEGAQLICL